MHMDIQPLLTNRGFASLARQIFMAALFFLGFAASPAKAQDIEGKNVSEVAIKYTGPATIDEARLRTHISTRAGEGYRSENSLDPAALEDGARAWGCFADHHVWPLEEVYLNGNPAARRYIPHTPFRPFQQVWAELGAGSH